MQILPGRVPELPRDLDNLLRIPRQVPAKLLTPFGVERLGHDQFRLDLVEHDVQSLEAARFRMRQQLLEARVQHVALSQPLPIRIVPFTQGTLHLSIQLSIQPLIRLTITKASRQGCAKFGGPTG